MFKVRTALLWLSFDVALSDAVAYLDAANWMRSNIEWLGKRTLKEICLPGTHNSGMSKLFGGTSFSKTCNSVNQGRNIRRQLDLGIRFFDVRPVITTGGVYRVGHYSKIFGNVWQGGYGHTIESIVLNINAFCKDHYELIFFRLSHSHNTEKEYSSFTQQEWNNLFQLLNKTENLYHATEDTYFPITTLEKFTNNGTKAAVIYIVDEPKYKTSLGDYTGKGFFYKFSLKIFDKYSETDKVDFLFMDQTAKMKKESEKRYFLLSWTLTQQAVDATMCPAMGKTIKDLAFQANRRLKNILLKITKTIYPNIISIDYVDNTELVELVMAVNLKWLTEKSLH
ncbi:unnamed protein product [Nezara viridula]|uniref:Uncharacterized protein n=1 Tax=Nezara viridula TaxID=85310 RepID=A0A9P0EBZ4_NEZVI|nr:unnamed protein product [Nezara viridula]